MEPPKLPSMHYKCRSLQNVETGHYMKEEEQFYNRGFGEPVWPSGKALDW